MNKNIKKPSGILGGLLLLIVGASLLWTNEGRTVKNQNAIEEANNSYITIKNHKINSNNDGKLVVTEGKLSADSSNELVDNIFGIRIYAIKMKRVVEIYQWKETCETKNKKTKCNYEKIWSDKLIDSSNFKESNHDNPTKALYDSEEYISENVKLGEFKLPEELVKSLRYDKKKTNSELISEYNNSKEDIRVDGKYLTNSKDDKIEIGDVRISYEYTSPKIVSIMAVQKDDTFEAFTSKKGVDIYEIVEGNKTGTQILEIMTKSNNRIKWLQRILGTFVIILSIRLCISSISKIFNKIPILGSIANVGTILVSTMLGFGISLIIIAIAWFRFRPVLSIVLIVVAIVLIILLKFSKKDKKEEKYSSKTS